MANGGDNIIQQSTGNPWTDVAIQGGTQVLGTLAQGYWNQQAFDQEIELMDIAQQNQIDLMGIQQGHQMALNQQGADLQYQMWEDTNYPAQIAMLREAGLNPALMYKQGGPAGTTGSQGGGSAAGGQAQKGSAPSQPQVELFGLQAKLLEAQINKLNTESGKIEEDTEYQNIVNKYVDEKQQKELNILGEQYEKAIGEARQAKADATLKEIIIKFKEQGILDNGESIQWLSQALGWDMTSDKALNEKMHILPENVRGRLKQWGINWEPGMTRRAFLTSLNMAIATKDASVEGIRWVIEQSVDILNQ